MAIPHSGSFRDLKEILANYGCIGDTAQIPYEVKERTYMLCSNFLGGTWKTVPVEGMCLTRMKGGMSNMLFLCKLPEGYKPIGNEPDKTLLRVYFNPETESHLVAESVIFTLLSERQLGPKLYGIFNGGRLEEYIVSRPLQCSEIRVPEISRKIAGKLAHVHKLSVPISKEPTYLCEALERWMSHLLEVAHTVRPFEIQTPSGDGSSSSRAITINEEMLRAEIEIIRWMNLLGKKHSSKQTTSTIPIDLENGKKIRVINLDDLKDELHVVRRALKKSTSPIVFCHNDLQEGNILLPMEQPTGSKDLVFIDFEYSSYNYRAFDFANHFCEWTIDYTLEQAPHFSVSPENFPTEEEQANFVRSYLSEQKNVGVSGGDQATSTGDEISQEAIRAVIEETAAFVPVSHFLWGIWALLQVELSPVKFGFAEYGRMRLSYYFQLRNNLLNLLKSNKNGTNGDSKEAPIDQSQSANTNEINGQADHNGREEN